jgi:nucleoside-diphosphate-sugar epimerase
LDSVDHVFHLAAQTSSYVANNDPLADLEANVTPVLQMLEACRQGGLKPAILFSGTATEMGLPQRMPVDESAQDLPITVYDIHKLAGEKYLQFYSREAGVSTVTLRLANVYGPGRNVGSGDRGVLNLMVKNGLNNQPLTVYGDGTNVRDYIFIDDVVSAFLAAGADASKLSGNYYLVGSGEGTRIVDAFTLVADRIEFKMGFRPAIDHVPSPESLSPIEDRDFIADSRAFRLATGWVAQVSLSDGIDRIIEHLVAQQEAPPHQRHPR